LFIAVIVNKIQERNILRGRSCPMRLWRERRSVRRFVDHYTPTVFPAMVAKT